MHPLATLIIMTVITISFGWFCHIHSADFGRTQSSLMQTCMEILNILLSEALLLLTVTGGTSDKSFGHRIIRKILRVVDNIFSTSQVFKSRTAHAAPPYLALRGGTGTFAG